MDYELYAVIPCFVINLLHFMDEYKLLKKELT